MTQPSNDPEKRRVQIPISFAPINENNLGQLRKLNASILPVRYFDKFYKDVLQTPYEYTKFAELNGYVVGAICGRVEPCDDGGKRLYIMTLGVLAAYRGNGIGTRLLESALHAAKQDVSLREIYLHVQTSNEEAIDFYKKFGFDITETIHNYYKRIDPPDCYILKKILSEK